MLKRTRNMKLEQVVDNLTTPELDAKIEELRAMPERTIKEDIMLTYMLVESIQRDIKELR